MSNGIAGVLVEAVGFNVMFLILSAISLVAVAVLLMVNTKRRRVDAKKGYSKLMTTDWVESVKLSPLCPHIFVGFEIFNGVAVKGDVVLLVKLQFNRRLESIHSFESLFVLGVLRT